MIHVADLRFAYPALAGGLSSGDLWPPLSFTVAAGEALAVMGASDSGKSTLCHILAGLAPRYTDGEVGGRVRVAGHDVLGARPPLRTVGVLFQDAAMQLFNASVETEVAWGLEALGLAPDAIDARVAEALARFGLRGLAKRSPGALSGGQQKRLALASVWAMRPRVWLLDEPLGGLDPQGRREVLAALDTLRQGGTTLLLTTLRPQAAQMAPRALLLHPPATSHHATAALLDAESALVEAGVHYPPRFWPALTGPTREAPAVTLEGVAFRYAAGQSPVLHDINLRIPQGQFVALVGANGAGKSTLARLLNGLLRPERGTVRVMGEPTAEQAVGALARRVGFLFQRPEQQIFGTTVREEIAYGPRQLRLPEVERRVAAALERFALDAVADVPPAVLGYGRRRAVTLAALSALDTPILVLDEPTVGLDGRGWAQLLAWLRARRAAGVTLILITHEMALAACADRVVALEAGRVVADGPPDAVLPGIDAGALA